MPSLAPPSTISTTIAEMGPTLRRAAQCREAQTGYGKLSFYAAVVLLALVAVGFVGTAIYAVIMGGDANRSAVAGGIVGAVVTIALDIGLIGFWTKRARKGTSE